MPTPEQLTVIEEIERDRAERLHHQEAVTRWRTPPAEAPEITKDSELPKVSNGGSYLSPPGDAPWHDWE